MSGIRVTYSGVLSFVVGIASVVTGLIFTLIVTRQLTQEEFGTWGLIGSLTAYALIFRPVVAYWNTREIARGEESGKTAFMSSGIFGLIAIIIYLLIAYIFGNQIDVNLEILLFAVILIPGEYVRSVLVGISHGYRPQNEEFGIVGFEFSKIILALFLIFVLDLGLTGAIIATAISTLVGITILLIKTFEKIKGKLKKDYLKKWLKFFWLPIYPNISQIINVSDIAAFSIITGSVYGLAYWSAAMTVSRIVNHSLKIGKGVYPKLLEGGRREYFQENMTYIFYFAFPMAAISLVFAKPALFALNPLYEIAFPVVIFLVPMIFLRMLNELFSQALRGIEKVDVKENSTFRDYIKSKLFYVPTLRNIQRAGYLIILVGVLLSITSFTTSQVELVMVWSIVALITQIPLTFFLYRMIKREFSPKLAYKNIIKYFIASLLVFSLTSLLMEQYLEYKESIFEFLPEFLKFVVLGVISYLVLTYIIDSKTKKLFKSIIKEIKSK